MKFVLKLFFLGLFLFSNIEIANAQSLEDCNVKLHFFSTYVKAKNYTEAEPILADLRKNCPSYNFRIYSYGERLYKAKLNNSSNKIEVAKDLIQLYKDRFKYIPAKTNLADVNGDIGSLMVKYKIGSLNDQFLFFDEAFNDDYKNFKSGLALFYYFYTYTELSKDATENISTEGAENKYIEIIKKFKEEIQYNKEVLDLLENAKSEGSLTYQQKSKQTVVSAKFKSLNIFLKKLQEFKATL